MRDPWETDEPVKDDPSVTPKNDANIDPLADGPLEPRVALHHLPMEKAKPTGENSPSKSCSVADKTLKPLGFFTLNRDNFLQGIIWAEILGKPLSKRRRR